MSILPVANVLRNSAQPVSNIYQDNSNLQVSSARVLNKEAYRFGFQSLTLGSSANTLTIPKNLMGSHVLIEFKFAVTPATLPVGYYLPHSWGYNLLRRLTLVYGGSEQLEIDCVDNFMRIVNECEDDRKKAALISLGGRPLYNNAGSIVGLDPGSGTPATGGTATAVIVVYLAHSSPNAMRQIPFDFGCLNMNATIRADLRSVEDVWLKTKLRDDTAPAAVTDAMRGLNKAEWIVGQQVMIDSSASKAALVSSSGQYQLNYFWTYPGHFESTFTLPAVRAADPATTNIVTISEPVGVTLNAFRNGALLALVIFVERLDGFEDRYNPQEAGKGMRNPFNYLELTDIKLEFGGQIVYTAANSVVAQALDAMINTTDSTYNYPLMTRTGLNAVGELADNRSKYYRVQLAQFSEVFRDYLMACGAQMSSDTMQLSFRVVDNRAVINNDASVSTIRYKCNVQYLYQCSLSVQKGTGSFSFVNPSPAPLPQQQLSITP